MEDERHFYDSFSKITSSINGCRTRVFRTRFIFCFVLRLKLDSAVSGAVGVVSVVSAVSAAWAAWASGGGGGGGGGAEATLYVSCWRNYSPAVKSFSSAALPPAPTSTGSLLQAFLRLLFCLHPQPSPSLLLHPAPPSQLVIQLYCTIVNSILLIR